ncbi:hypothetical protein J32TS6_39080 [Virgibacillus pantothenticus]|nr:hypothetical protein J32TS6_39080 [Virgibacillus pantothenticus]
MGLVMEIVRSLLPIAIAGGGVISVIKRLEYQHKQGTLGKKKIKNAQNLLDSLIPMGMLFGGFIGVFLGMFSSISPLTSVSLGIGLGYLSGYFAYEVYTKNGESSP